MAVLLFDGHCSLCDREARRLARLTGGAVALESFRDPGVLDRYPGVSLDECEQALQLVEDGIPVASGAAAVAAVLSRTPRWRWLGALLRAPVVSGLAAIAYHLIATNRYRLSRSTCPAGTCGLHAGTDAGPTTLAGDFGPTVRVFFRALGLVYLFVFVSLALQVGVLVGSDGLLPAGEFLTAHAGDGVSRFWRYPTLFWLWTGDAALRGGAFAGVALAGALLAGWRPRLCVAGLWLLFLSYVTVGRDFFWFQWDTLLLEATFLTLFLPAGAAGRPHVWILFLFRWLLFRLLFESGLAKVQAGAGSWYPLTAMASYYETAPLPSIGGWWAHQLPLWAHRWTTALTLLGELLGPLLIWGPRSARRVAFVLIVGFQVILQATANYGYFNILTAALAIFVLDARDLRWLPSRLTGIGDTTGARPAGGGLPVWFGRVAAVLIFLLTVLELMILLAAPGVLTSRFLVAVREVSQSFRIAGRYHLFAHIDPRRVEAEIEWTPDGQAWRAYEFHYKPGPLERRPPMVAPHQPRVDFQLWFFTMGRDGGAHEYFNTLVRRLCRQPESVGRLFVAPSLPVSPPLAIRVAYYRYRMTDPSTLRHEGRYWSRQLLDYHPLAYFCDSADPPRF